MRRGWIFLLFMGCLATASWGDDPFETCLAQLKNPEKLDPYCLYELSLNRTYRDRALTAFGQLAEQFPANPQVFYYWGFALYKVDNLRAARLFQKSGLTFRQDGDLGYALRAYRQANLLLVEAGELEAAEKDAALMAEIAALSGNVNHLSWTFLCRANIQMRKGHHLTQALHWLLEAEAKAFPSGSIPVKRMTLSLLGDLHYRLGVYERASGYFYRLKELANETGDKETLSLAEYQLACLALGLADGPEGREKGYSLLSSALGLATNSGNLDIVAKSHLGLGRLEHGEAQLTHLKEAVRISFENENWNVAVSSLFAQALAHLATEPDRARGLWRQAEQLAQDPKTPWTADGNWKDRMLLRWKLFPRDQAITESLEDLAMIEDLRDLEDSGYSRTGHFSVWSDAYHVLAGLILETSPLTQKDLEIAFELNERLRGRSILDALDRQVSPNLSMDLPKQHRLKELGQTRVSLYRQLRAGLAEPLHSQTLRRLAQVEADEALLRNELIREIKAPSTPQRFVRLAELSDMLAPEEAVFSFQFAPETDVFGDPAGGSWLTVTTRSGSKVYRLGDGNSLQRQIRMFVGLFQNPELAMADEASAFLYGRLLAPALAELPPEIRSVVLIPEGPLHFLPFAVLRPSGSAPFFGERFVLTHAPSATVWAEWRRAPVRPDQSSALIFADPALPGTAEGAAQQGDLVATRTFGSQLATLPYARQEGSAIARTLGKRAQFFMGSEASEGAFKEYLKDPVGLIHFAAHALMDEDHPGRSAVVLVPGNEREDGLLQADEVVDLPLKGRVVVLSSCESAAGSLQLGEGAMSLANAFFQGGSRAMVATLWKIRDDEAAALFQAFYKFLAKGESLAEALQHAQAARREAGAPASGWAGVVVLGDGGHRPFPQPLDAPPNQGLWIGIGLLILVSAAALWLYLRPARL